MNQLVKLIDFEAALKTARTDGSGFFEAVVASWSVDLDDERFARDAFDEQDGKRVPLRYLHNVLDESGEIGVVRLHPQDDGLHAIGQLDLSNTMALAIYERMLLPTTDRRALHEFSLGFAFDPTETTRGPRGERVFQRAVVLEVSVVARGAQVGTHLVSIKEQSPAGEAVCIRRSRSETNSEFLARMRTEFPAAAAELARVELLAQAEKIACERRAKARDDLRAFHAATMGELRSRVLITSRMTLVWDEVNDEREADRRERENAEREHRQAVRDRERDETPESLVWVP